MADGRCVHGVGWLSLRVAVAPLFLLSEDGCDSCFFASEPINECSICFVRAPFCAAEAMNHAKFRHLLIRYGKYKELIFVCKVWSGDNFHIVCSLLPCGALRIVHISRAVYNFFQLFSFSLIYQWLFVQKNGFQRVILRVCMARIEGVRVFMRL